MSSLAEFIPIELINHILSFRPRHPVAELIKKYKESLFEEISSIVEFEDIIDYSHNITFKEFHIDMEGISDMFSSCIRPNSIYKIKTKKYRTSEGFYWGKYYTEKKAIKEFEKAKDNYYTGDMYSISLVNIDNICLNEHILDVKYTESKVDSYWNNFIESDSDYEFNEDDIHIGTKIGGKTWDGDDWQTDEEDYE